jgi:hypothetical protein
VRGNLTYRNLQSENSADFRTRLVKRAALAEALPADSARVTPEERARLLHARFDGVRRRYKL